MSKTPPMMGILCKQPVNKQSCLFVAPWPIFCISPCVCWDKQPMLQFFGSLEKWPTSCSNPSMHKGNRATTSLKRQQKWFIIPLRILNVISFWTIPPKNRWNSMPTLLLASCFTFFITTIKENISQTCWNFKSIWSQTQPFKKEKKPPPQKKKTHGFFDQIMDTMTFTAPNRAVGTTVTPCPAGSTGCIGSTVSVRQGLADGLGRPTALMITMVATMAAVGARGMKVGFGI